MFKVTGKRRKGPEKIPDKTTIKQAILIALFFHI